LLYRHQARHLIRQLGRARVHSRLAEPASPDLEENHKPP